MPELKPKLIAFPEWLVVQSSGRQPSLPCLKAEINGAMHYCYECHNADEAESICHFFGIQSPEVIQTDHPDILVVQVNAGSKKAAARQEEEVDLKRETSRPGWATPELRRKYMDLCGLYRRDKNISEAEKNVADISNQIVKLQKTLVSSIQQTNEYERVLSAEEGIKAKLEERFGREFEELASVVDLKNVDIQENEIYFFAPSIAIEHEGETYDIGNFFVKISAKGNEGVVQMRNMKQPIEGFQHPHVNEKFEPVLANIREILPSFVGECQFADACSICMEYLHNYEEDAAGPFKRIENWPKAVETNEERCPTLFSSIKDLWKGKKGGIAIPVCHNPDANLVRCAHEVGGEDCFLVTDTDFPEALRTLGLGEQDLVISPISHPDVQFFARSKEELRRKYFALCGVDRYNASMQKMQKEFEDLRQKVENSKAELKRSLGELGEWRKRLTALATTDEAVFERFGTEFDALSRHPDIEKIEIDTDREVVYAYTAPISIRHKGTTYHIGKFEVTLPADGRVRMKNLTKKYGSYDHPHVDNEVPCLGNIKETLPDLLKKRRYSAAAILSIEYLKSYTKDDGFRPHSGIENW